jgi:hypothetical protein
MLQPLRRAHRTQDLGQHGGMASIGGSVSPLTTGRNAIRTDNAGAEHRESGTPQHGQHSSPRKINPVRHDPF